MEDIKRLYEIWLVRDLTPSDFEAALTAQPVAQFLETEDGEFNGNELEPVGWRECAASGQSCEDEPIGPNGEMQCKYCGSAAPPGGSTAKAWRLSRPLRPWATNTREG